MMRALKQQLAYRYLKIQALVRLSLGKPLQALLRFERLLALRPADRYALASRAHVLAQLGKRGEAIASLRQLTGLPGSPGQQAAAWFNLGYALQQDGQHAQALPAFETAAGYCPAMDRAWYGLALALIEQGRFEEAQQALEKTTALQPMGPHGWYRLAEVHRALGQPEKARQVLERLRQFEPRVARQLERELRLGEAAGAATGPLPGQGT